MGLLRNAGPTVLSIPGSLYILAVYQLPISPASTYVASKEDQSYGDSQKETTQCILSRRYAEIRHKLFQQS
jgi:hypothetical protein